jgi:hypothetical protein
MFKFLIFDSYFDKRQYLYVAKREQFLISKCKNALKNTYQICNLFSQNVKELRDNKSEKLFTIIHVLELTNFS